MAITSASVEANGWVLRVTHTAGLGSFASYTLDPNGVPTLTLAVVSSGYVQSGGTAIAGTTTRRLIATKPLRKPVSATNAGVRAAKTIDEIDNGDGSVTVRIALSQHVYATDTGLTITALAGWRSGQAAQTIGVTNNSTLSAPQPLARWSDVPYQLQEGSFDLEVVVAAQHPNGVSPVAGVRFSITDGTTVKTMWATALSTSTRFGDALRVFRVTVDPTIATALTKGLLRCDYEVYPWVGAARLSDTAGTRSMAGLGTVALSGAAQVPFVVAYNAAGAWITPRYAYVVADGSGAATASAGLVGTVAATASATPCNSINIAIESLRLHAVANTGVGTLAAANGQAAIAQSVDGCRVRLKAGTGAHPGVGTAAVSTGIQTLAAWLVIEGDPADAAPRTNVILRTPTAANGTMRATKTLLRKLSVEMGTNAVVTASSVWLDDVETRAVSGSETLAVVPFSSTIGLWLTNARWWKYGLGAAKSGTTQLPVLIRNCEVERALCAPVMLNNRRLPSAIVGTAGITGDGSATAPSLDAARTQDRVAIGNDLRYVSGSNAMLFSYLANASAPVSPRPGNALGSAYVVVARQAFINNICESYGASFPMMLPVGENTPAVLTDTIIEGNTFTGDRLNIDYNDLNMATIALSDSADSIALLNRRANNITTKNATKHDFFADPTVALQRQGTGIYSLATSRNKAKAVGDELTANSNIYRCITAGTTATTGGPSGTGSDITDGTAHWAWFAVIDPRQHGYRPQATGAWSATYGVGFEGNIDVQPLSVSDPEFYSEFFGVGSLQMSAAGLEPATSPFTLDKSGTNVGAGQMPWLVFDAANTGGGNYRPLTTGTGAYIAGRARTANVDRDQAGFARMVPFAAGALQSGLVALVPAATRHATTSGAGHVGWAALLGVSGARQSTRSTSSQASWTATLAVAGARMTTRAHATLAVWSGSLLPRRSVHATRAGSTLATVVAPLSLTPASARHAVRDAVRPIVLPAAPTPPERTLTVTGDFRLTLVD